MGKTILLFIITLFVLFMSGCAQKVNMRALEPAEIDRAAATKKIAVANFSNDRVGLSGKIEAKLSRFKIDNKSYFTIVSRNDFNRIVEEQKIQNSGLVDQDTYFYERRSRCADKKCKELIYYKVRCKKRVVGLSAELRMVDISQGDIIYADTMNRARTFTHCSDDSRALPSREMVVQELAESIANSFIYKLTPHYRNFRVVLLEYPDLDYNDKQEELLEVSLKYREQGRFDKAERFLIDLIDSTGSQSYVAFYNLGVVKEAEGSYAEAKEYYENADNLMVEPVEEINAAVIRIHSLIEKRERTLAQLAR
ncbi:MAG: hypothetical protein ABFQ64_02975 [Campylobacterota bacterium]